MGSETAHGWTVEELASISTERNRPNNSSLPRRMARKCPQAQGFGATPDGKPQWAHVGVAMAGLTAIVAGWVIR